MLAVLVLCVAPSDNAPRVNADEGVLVFSVRRWAGEYESRDIPGGVKTPPSTSSIHSIRSDGTDSRKLVAIKKAVCASPVFRPDAKWLYFQSNASGEYHIYRCRPDGSAREQLTSEKQPGQPWKKVFGLQMTATGRLLCTAYDGKKGCVAVLAADGTQIRLVASHLGYLYMSEMSVTSIDGAVYFVNWKPQGNK